MTTDRNPRIAAEGPKTFPQPPLTTGPSRSVAVGLIYGFGAYGLWGVVFPLQLLWMKRLIGGSATAWAGEFLAHRIVWCVLICLGLVIWRGQRRDLFGALTRPRTVGFMAITTTLVCTNWAVFIVAAATNRLAEASLGYFINPLFTLLLGAVFLGERLRPLQTAAVVVAGAGVAYRVFAVGQPPWIALFLASTFATYSLLRKRGTVPPVVGLTIETSLALPFALGYLAWLQFGIAADQAGGAGPRFAAAGPMVTALFVLSGLTTALPLLWFTASAKRLRLSTVSFMQFLSPTCQFVIAITVGGERVRPQDLPVFGLIWLGVGLFTAGSFRRGERARAVAPAAAAAEALAADSPASPPAQDAPYAAIPHGQAPAKQAPAKQAEAAAG